MDNILKRIEDLKTLGIYRRAFFYIELNSNRTLLDSDLLQNGSFIHEYVHYLQDISTAYGLANIAFTADRIKVFGNKLRACESDIGVPLNDEPDFVSCNQDLFFVYRGCDDNFDDVIEIEGKLEEIVFENIPDCKPIYLFILELRNNNNEVKTYEFGANTIMESMANIIEETLFGHQNVPDFPYRGVELLVKNLYPQLYTNNAILVALCEVSLMYLNPGEVFIKIIYSMKEDCFVPRTINEVYDYANKNFGLEKYEKIEDYVFEISKYAKNGVGTLFPEGKLKPTVDWAVNCIDRALVVRKHKPFFLSEIVACSSREQALNYLGVLMKGVGIPTIFNGDNEMLFPELPEADVIAELFRLIFEIYKMFTAIDFRCGLRNICSNQPGMVTRECTEAPWEKINCEMLCPFAAVWRTWGLEGKKLVEKYPR